MMKLNSLFLLLGLSLGLFSNPASAGDYPCRLSSETCVSGKRLGMFGGRRTGQAVANTCRSAVDQAMNNFEERWGSDHGCPGTLFGVPRADYNDCYTRSNGEVVGWVKCAGQLPSDKDCTLFMGCR